MILMLGIDIGTSGIKAVTIDQAGATRSFFSVPYKAVSNGWHSWEYLEKYIRTAVAGNVAQLADQGIDSREAIRSIGISAVCPSVVGMRRGSGMSGGSMNCGGGDKSCGCEQTTDILLYNDMRSQAEADEILHSVGTERFFDASKNRVFPGGVSATSILWLKNHENEAYNRSDIIGHVNTMLGLTLTGELAIDPSHASCTGLFETAGDEDKWNYGLCEELGIDASKLPHLVSSNEAIGGLCNPAYIDLGLSEGIPVSVGGNDTSCAALAAGAVHDGDLFESCGSTDVLCYVHSGNESDDFPADFINRKHVVDGLWIANGALSSGGTSLKWFAERFSGDGFDGDADLYERVEQSAMQSVPGADGVIFLPFMRAERAPFWWTDPNTGFFGVDANTSQCHLARAVYEASGYGVRMILDKLTSIYPVAADKIFAVGGGTQNLYQMQIKADILQRDYSIGESNYAAAKGAAILGGQAAEIYKEDVLQSGQTKTLHHDPSLKDVYDEGYQAFLDLVNRK